MQITIYLPDETIRNIDSTAKRKGISRSAYIQSLLKRGMENEGKGSPPVNTLSTFGAWTDLRPDQIREIRRHLGKDIKRKALR
jgi:hypothetical protein